VLIDFCRAGRIIMKASNWELVETCGDVFGFILKIEAYDGWRFY